MSLPPISSWKYNWSPKPNSEEAKLYEAIKPKDWVSVNEKSCFTNQFRLT